MHARFQAPLPPGPVGIVAGSGIDLRPLLDEVQEEIPFRAIPGLEESAVTGHPCRFVRGRTNGRTVLLQQGRLHLYEGFSLAEVTAPVDALAALGAAWIVFSNAVGGIAPALKPRELVAANRLHAWPCAHASLPPLLMPDLVLPGCDHTGAYYWMHGPCYETRAEIRALQRLNADTVGMSTFPELWRCRERDIPAGVVSCVTNVCQQAGALTHAEVVAVAARASKRLCALLRAAL